MDVRDMGFNEHFHGIWACASLLHVPYDDMLYTFEKIWNALKYHGIFYFSFKEGQGEGIDEDGRYFTYLTEEDIENILSKFTFVALDKWVDKDYKDNTSCVNWLNYVVKK
jgi:hypothetical protein